MSATHELHCPRCGDWKPIDGPMPKRRVCDDCHAELVRERAGMDACAGTASAPVKKAWKRAAPIFPEVRPCSR